MDGIINITTILNIYLMGVKTIHWDVNIKINQPADNYPVIDQLLPLLYDGDPLGVARRPAVDSRVYADS